MNNKTCRVLKNGTMEYKKWKDLYTGDIIFTILNRKDLKRAVATIREHNPKAFYTVEDVRGVNEDLLPVEKSLLSKRFVGSILRWRPGK